MAIVDFNNPEPWDSLRIWRFNGTSRIRQRIAESGVRSDDPSKSILAIWHGVPQIHLGFCRFPVMRENRVHRAAKLPKNLNIGSGDRVLLMGDVYGWTAEALAEVVPDAAFVAVDPTPFTQARAVQTETAYLQSQIAAAEVKTVSEADAAAQKAAETGSEKDQRWAKRKAGEAARISDPAMQSLALAEFDDGLPRARRVVVDEDAANQGSRNRIRNELGGTPTHSITMGMLNFLFDNECTDISARLHDMGTGSVFHIVNTFRKPAHGKPEPEPPLNWKHISGNASRDTMVADRDGNTRPLDAEPGIGAKSWKALLPNDWIVPESTSYNVFF